MSGKQTSTIQADSGNNYIYYNIILTNVTGKPILASYNEVRAEGIIDNPSQYYLSVVRATIPTDTMPLFNFEPIYTVTIVDNVGIPYMVSLAYLDLTPSESTKNIYSIQQFLTMVNTALTQAFNNAVVGGNMGGTTSAPYMVFDPSTQIISMYVQTDYATDNIGVYMNCFLYDLFGNFEVIQYGYSLANGMDVKFLIQDNRNPNTKAISGFYQLQQEYACTSLFYDARSIEFTTGSIPIRPEYIPGRLNILGSSQVGANNSRLIITDIEFPLGESVINVKPYLQYTAPSLYRLIDMNSTSPLRQIDIQVSYVDELGIYTPLTIAPNDSMTIKLVFVRKSVLNK